MKNYLRSTVAALGYGLLTAGVLAPTVALAQPVSAPRQFNSQTVHYIRASLSPTMCAQAAGGGTCSFKVPVSVPYNSIILRVTAAIGTAFNSTTTDVLFLGTVTGSGNIVAAGCSIHTAAQVACTIQSAGLSGINNIGNGATQTGLNGGFDLFVTWTYTGATAATAGNGALIIEYVAPNDGNCTATPMGATAVGC